MCWHCRSSLSYPIGVSSGARALLVSALGNPKMLVVLADARFGGSWGLLLAAGLDPLGSRLLSGICFSTSIGSILGFLPSRKFFIRFSKNGYLNSQVIYFMSGYAECSQ